MRFVYSNQSIRYDLKETKQKSKILNIPTNIKSDAKIMLVA